MLVFIHAAPFMSDEGEGAMGPEFMDDMFDEKLRVQQDVMYKVLDRSDSENQGLYKMCRTHYIDRRGMSVSLKHAVETGDIFLVDVFFEDENLLIKACCEAVSCSEKEDGTFRARLDFIIIKDLYREFWEDYLARKLEEAAV